MENTNSSGDGERCQKVLQLTVARNQTVHKLVDSIESLGCKIPSDFFACKKCDGDISGGFLIPEPGSKDYKPQIILCDNRRLEIETFENTVIHELVHAYDLCRVKAFDWRNCSYHACAEIRASSLSGECSVLHEIFRGKSVLSNGHRNCVKRRATKSVAMNPVCKDFAAEAVEQVFDKCYKDTSPFDFPR